MDGLGRSLGRSRTSSAVVRAWAMCKTVQGTCTVRWASEAPPEASRSGSNVGQRRAGVGRSEKGPKPTTHPCPPLRRSGRPLGSRPDASSDGKEIAAPILRGLVSGSNAMPVHGNGAGPQRQVARSQGKWDDSRRP
eukprot:scaffold810_cov355-Pavlova_lutheri.AAC.15